MKKTLYTVLGTALTMAPMSVFAAGISPTTKPENLPTEISFGALLIAVINWFLGLVGLLAVLMLIYGGFRYLTSGGNEESTTKAKNTIIYAIIGIVIVILSYAIVFTITDALGTL